MLLRLVLRLLMLQRRPCPSEVVISLYPCQLTEDTDQSLVDLARDLVKAWGDSSLSVIELEERIATAAEKAPTDDAQIAALRAAIARVKAEYDVWSNRKKPLCATPAACM